MTLNDIGEVIRTSRKQRKLSQQQLAASLGMSRATISGIETGRIAEVGIRKMAALCSALGLEITVGKRRAYPTLQELRQEQLEKPRA